MNHHLASWVAACLLTATTAPLCAQTNRETPRLMTSARPGNEVELEQSCRYVPFQEFATFDHPWRFFRKSLSVSPIPAALDSPAPPYGIVGFAPPGTEAIGVSFPAGQTFPTSGTWTTDLATHLAGDTIYRVQAVVEHTSPATGVHAAVSIKLGSITAGGAGFGELELPEGSTSMVAGEPTVATLYHWTKTPSSGSWYYANPILQFECSNPTGGPYRSHSAQVSSITIDAIPRSCLKVTEVLDNRGISTLSAHDGWTPPPSPTAISAPSFAGLHLQEYSGSGSPGLAVVTSSTSAPVPGAFNFIMSGPAPTGSWNEGPPEGTFLAGPDTQRFPIRNDRLYSLDVWVRSNTTPQPPVSRLPELLLTTCDDWGAGISVDQMATSRFALSPDQNFDGSNDNAGGLTTAGVARHYAHFWKPDLDQSTNPAMLGAYRLGFDYGEEEGMLSSTFSADALAIWPKADITIERIVFTEHRLP